MAANDQERTQKTQPRGVDKDGKPAKPIDIPVPPREAFDKLVRRASKKKPAKRA